MSENKIVVDARGDACPIPVVKTLKALGTLGGPGEVETIVDNKIAVENLTRMAGSKGCASASEQTGEKEWHVVTTATAAVEVAAGEPEAAECYVPAAKNVVIQVASDAMGTGDDELGHKLIKGFIFSLTQLDELPATMLFYNGGARLTCEGSASLEDLKNLADAGVEILTCGTCLDHYGLSEKLAVGEVTNMYVIAQKLTGASVVVRP
ncbi:sulfurtransferase-like selenium metabolism protein YedF [Paratractidigestivibacter sp.]|uniref:sulfurtransferase-like selenium metabolism protein YedF n=1 Tax=Paratractidigestivibacter sp. TaxID=2847316 RepID=UPI002AC929A4|nr:sulfurtransferase-like selenium metabolism protein YedF [Paratractidigestivibacter sp.]